VNLRAALDPYAKYAQWSSLAATPSDFASMSPSPSLDGFFQTTSVLLGFLADTLAPGSLRRITRRYCASVQRRIYDNILMYYTFSAAGASQLKRDLSAIKESIEKSTKLRGVIGGSMKRLEDAVFLLSLDAATIVNASSDDGDEDGWGFGEEEAGPSTEVAPAASTRNDFDEKKWGLWDAEKLVFQSNEAARKALADMGLYHLSEAEARNILKRRAELNG
jgi:hypothetical protein